MLTLNMQLFAEQHTADFQPHQNKDVFMILTSIYYGVFRGNS